MKIFTFFVLLCTVFFAHHGHQCVASLVLSNDEVRNRSHWISAAVHQNDSVISLDLDQSNSEHYIELPPLRDMFGVYLQSDDATQELLCYVEERYFLVYDEGVLEAESFDGQALTPSTDSGLLELPDMNVAFAQTRDGVLVANTNFELTFYKFQLSRSGPLSITKDRVIKLSNLTQTNVDSADALMATYHGAAHDYVYIVYREAAFMYTQGSSTSHVHVVVGWLPPQFNNYYIYISYDILYVVQFEAGVTAYQINPDDGSLQKVRDFKCQDFGAQDGGCSFADVYGLNSADEVFFLDELSGVYHIKIKRNPLQFVISNAQTEFFIPVKQGQILRYVNNPRLNITNFLVLITNDNRQRVKQWEWNRGRGEIFYNPLQFSHYTTIYDITMLPDYAILIGDDAHQIIWHSVYSGFELNQTLVNIESNYYFLPQTVDFEFYTQTDDGNDWLIGLTAGQVYVFPMIYQPWRIDCYVGTTSQDKEYTYQVYVEQRFCREKDSSSDKSGYTACAFQQELNVNVKGSSLQLSSTTKKLATGFVVLIVVAIICVVIVLPIFLIRYYKQYKSEKSSLENEISELQRKKSERQVAQSHLRQQFNALRQDEYDDTSQKNAFGVAGGAKNQLEHYDAPQIEVELQQQEQQQQQQQYAPQTNYQAQQEQFSPQLQLQQQQQKQQVSSPQPQHDAEYAEFQHQPHIDEDEDTNPQLHADEQVIQPQNDINIYIEEDDEPAIQIE